MKDLAVQTGSMDPANFSEWCLSCADKHLGLASINLVEVQQELARYNTLSLKAKGKLRNIQDQLAEAERHVTEGLKDADPKLATNLNTLSLEIAKTRKILERNRLGLMTDRIAPKCGDNCQPAIQETQTQLQNSRLYLHDQVMPLVNCPKCDMPNDQLEELLEETKMQFGATAPPFIEEGPELGLDSPLLVEHVPPLVKGSPTLVAHSSDTRLLLPRAHIPRRRFPRPLKSVRERLRLKRKKD